MFVRRISVLLYLTRIVGSVPYKITSHGLRKCNWARVYSVSMIFSHTTLVLITYNNTHVTPGTETLTIIRHILIVLLLISDVLMPLAMYGDFLTIFLEMDRFDKQINYRVPSLITIHSSPYPLLIITYPIFSVICTFIQPYKKNNFDIRQPAILCYAIINTVIDTNILLFMVLMESMFSRFRHLHRLVLAGGSTTLFGPRGEFSNDLGPREILMLYERLVATTAKINRHYSLQILFWISTACCSVIYRLHVISTATVYYDIINIIGNVIGVMSPALLAVSISSLCHFTVLEAKRIPISLFSPKIWTRYRAGGTMGDNSDVCMYFGLRILKITAGFGLVTVNLPAIILFVSLTSTYIQYLLEDST